jgi:hypothetical protein
MIVRKILIPSYLKKFALHYTKVKDEAIYLTKCSILLDNILAVTSGKNTRCFAHYKLDEIEVIFDESTKFLLNKQFDILVINGLRHLFWHKIFYNVVDNQSKGIEKVESIDEIIDLFDLDCIEAGEEGSGDIDREVLRRQLYRLIDEYENNYNYILAQVNKNLGTVKKQHRKYMGIANYTQLTFL